MKNSALRASRFSRLSVVTRLRHMLGSKGSSQTCHTPHKVSNILSSKTLHVGICSVRTSSQAYICKAGAGPAFVALPVGIKEWGD